MKRRDLERYLREHGARPLREGGRHSYWGFDAERSTALPRHREIHEASGPQLTIARSDWRSECVVCSTAVGS